MIGMMLHQDASPHAWLAGSGRSHDLVVTLDDATGAISVHLGPHRLADYDAISVAVQPDRQAA